MFTPKSLILWFLLIFTVIGCQTSEVKPVEVTQTANPTRVPATMEVIPTVEPTETPIIDEPTQNAEPTEVPTAIEPTQETDASAEAISLIPFESLAGGFEIEYPESWIVAQDTAAAGTIFIPNEEISAAGDDNSIIMVQTNGIATFGTNDPIELFNLAVDSIELDSEPAAITINGLDGAMAYTILDEGNVALWIFVIGDGERVGMIMFGVPIEKVDEYNPIVQTVVDTFALTEIEEPVTAEDYTDRGLAYYDMGDYDRAIADFTEAIALDPDYARAYHLRGFAYFDQEKYDQAIADYTQVLVLQPDYAQAYYERALNYYTMGNYEQAIDGYTEAIDINPDYALAYNNRGLTYYDMGDYEQAIVNFTQAIALDPDFASKPYTGRGLAYHAQENYERAIVDYTQAIALDPNFAAAYSSRGLTYQTQENYEQAIVDYTQALDRDPYIVEAYLNRVAVYKELENTKNTFEENGAADSGDIGIRSADDASMVYVLGTTFMMGGDKQPSHEITVDTFWIDQTEVTNEQYERCVADGICRQPKSFDNDLDGDRNPVVGVDWYDASVYCEWAGARLPTEAEWEYTAKGSDSNIYPWGNESPTCDLLNYCSSSCCLESTAIVGSYSPDGDSWVGVSDMAGNVWEWVDGQPIYQDDDPMTSSDEEVNALRGGGWTNDADGVRSASSYFTSPNFLSDALGFRCAVSGNGATTSNDENSESLSDEITCSDPLGCVVYKPEEPIVLASALILSGPNASLGLDSQWGVELAIDFREELLGHEIELRPFDDGCYAEGGQLAAQQIISDPEIVAVVGTSCSGSGVPAAIILSDAGYVMVSPSNTAPVLTDPGSHEAGYLRTAHNDNRQGRAVAEFAYNELGVRKAAAIHDGDPYTEALAVMFRSAFKELGGEIIAFKIIPQGSTDDVTVLPQ